MPKRDAAKTITELKCIARDWSSVVAGSNLSQHLAWQGLHSTIGRSITYHFPVSMMTWKQGDQIASLLYLGILPKLGVAWCFPKAYCYAPWKFLGLGLAHPYVEQGVRHLHDFLKLATHDSLVGHLLRASYKQSLLETGLGGTLFNHSFQIWGVHHTPSLLHRLWEFCQGVGVTLAAPRGWV